MSKLIPLRDRLIPWYFVLFFVVLAIVDGIMVTLAVRSQTGLVTDHPYEKGLAYNKIIQAADSQEKLQWRGEITYEVIGSKAVTLHFALHDISSQPVPMDSVTAYIVRPTRSDMDFTTTLQPASEGTFTGRIDFPQGGLWEIRLNVTAGNQHYHQSKRIVIE